MLRHTGFRAVALSKFTVGLLFALGLPSAARAKVAEPPWENLFNGRNLDGWVQRGGEAKYEVKNGTIVGSSVPNTPNSFLCTQRHYGDFVLEYEFKVDPRLNSGVQVRGQSRPDYRDGLVHGYQIEIDPDVKRGRLWTGGLYDEKRRGWLVDLTDNEAARMAFKPEKWNRIRVEARGPVIKTWVNGVAAVDAVDVADMEGFIGLQVHGVKEREEPLVIAWRKIRIKDFGQRKWRPVFDGKTTTGWTSAGGGKWAVHDGVLVGENERSEKAHGLLFFEKALPEYVLRAKVRAVKGNAGLYFAGTPVDEPVGARGLQLDIDPEKTSGLYETGGREWISRPGSRKDDKLGKKAVESWKKGDWNEVQVARTARRAVTFVNGFQTSWQNDEALGGDRIAWELNARQDVRLEIRDVEVLSERIPPAVPNYPIGWCILPDGSAPDDAKAMGYEFVEVAYQKLQPLSDADFDAVVQRYRELGLTVKSGYNGIPKDLRLVGPDIDVSAQNEAIAPMLARMQALGAQFVVFNAGSSWNIPDGFQREVAWKQLTDFSRRFAGTAKKHGLTVLVQPLRKKDSNVIVSVEEAIDLVRAVGRPNFKMLVDNSFLAINGEDPSVLRKARGLIQHVWVSNPQTRDYPMGADTSAYDAFFDALKRIRYRGGFAVHARTDNFRADAPAAQSFLRQQAEILAGPRRWARR